MKKLRVLVVEDSLTIRSYLTSVIHKDPNMEVVGEAGDGRQAVEMCARLKPDVVTLDMMLPEMNGVAATEQIMAYTPTPILIVSASVNRGEAFRTYDALAAGAVDVLDKPHADESMEDWEKRFLSSLRLVARIKVITHPRGRLRSQSAVAVADTLPLPGDPSSTTAARHARSTAIVAIGASTGGPAAIVNVLSPLPANYPIPVLVVLHISELFAFAFAEWLGGQISLPVRLAQDGERMPRYGTPGVILAPAGKHMILESGRIHLTTTEERNSCRPSIDELFESVAREVRDRATMILLTGMGKDGAQGLRAGKVAGAETVAQNEASSIVFGMPGEAIRLGAADHILAPDEIAHFLKGLPCHERRTMIAFQLHNTEMRARLAEVCSHIGRIPVSLQSTASLEEFLRFNSVALVVLEGRPDSADLIATLRSSSRTASTPILMVASPEQVSLDASHRPDAFMLPERFTERIEEEIRRLLHGSDEIDFAKSAPEAAGPVRILLIDDSLTYRMMLHKALTAAGYDVTLAATGESGLEEAFKTNFSAVMVDHMLPGIQGDAVIRRLRSESATRRIPCLLLTASEDPNNELDALEAGADSFVRKDEAIETILLRLAAVLRTSSGPSAFRFAPVAARRVMIAGAATPQVLALREYLLNDGVVVIEETSVETVYARAQRDPVDAVLLTLPPAESVGLCTRLKESSRSGKMRVLVLEVEGSAESAAEQQAAALQAGADDFIGCAMPARHLRARLETQLRRKHMEDENRALHDYVLRQQVHAETQRKLAAERTLHARELQVAKDEVEKEAHEAEAARSQLEKVLEALPQIVLMASEDGVLFSWNKRWTEYVGAPPPPDTTDMWRQVMPAEDFDRYAAQRTEALRIGRGFVIECRLRGSDGNYRWFYIQATPMKNLRGVGASRWLATCTDIHDRKLAEEALRRTEKLAATGRLAASIAHEINNPLEAVTNLLFLIEMSTQGQPDVHEYVVSAQQQIGRVSEISKKTLAFYRESKSPTPVDMAALVEETRDVYAARLRNKNMPFELDVRTHRQPVGLSGELRQVVSNMVANAIDASPHGATLSVRISESRNWSNDRKGIRVTVCDRGAGIPARLRPDLFKPFVTTKGQNGTGLGLWVAHSIAARHEGDLRFWSSDRPPHTGTCFSFFLPWDGRVTTSDDSIGEMMKQIGSELLQKEN